MFNQIRSWYAKTYKKREGRIGSKYNKILKVYDKFLDYAKIKNSGKVLDVGCGGGWLLEPAKRRGLDVYGIDMSFPPLKIAKDQKIKNLCVARGEKIPFKDDVFDFVTCLGSLQYFEYIRKGLHEMKRVCKKNNTLCIMVPNINFWLWKIKPEKGMKMRNLKNVKGWKNLNEGSGLKLTFKQWKTLLEENNLKIIRVYKDRYPSRILNDLKSLLKRILLEPIWYITPFKYCYQFIFICKSS